MCHANNEKRKTVNDVKNRTTKSRKIRTLGKMKTYKYLGIFKADAIKQAEMKEKILKRVTQKNEKTTQNQTIQQKSHQRDKYLDCLYRKIFGTILKVDQRRTSTNGQENKKTNGDA